MTETEGYITTSEAAERLGVNRQRVWALIKAGRLPAVKPGRDWLIRAEDLELVKDRKPGRPPVDLLTKEQYRAHGLEVVRWIDPPILRCETCGETWRGRDWRCPTGCNAGDPEPQEG